MEWFHPEGMERFRPCVRFGKKTRNGMVPYYVRLEEPGRNRIAIIMFIILII